MKTMTHTFLFCMFISISYALAGVSGFKLESDLSNYLDSSDAVYIGKVTSILSEKGGEYQINKTIYKGKWKTVKFDIDTAIKGENANSIIVKTFNQDFIRGEKDVSTNLPKDVEMMIFVNLNKELDIFFITKSSPTFLVDPKRISLADEQKLPSKRLVKILLQNAQSGNLQVSLDSLRYLANLNLEIEGADQILKSLSHNDEPSISASAFIVRVKKGDVESLSELSDKVSNGVEYGEYLSKISRYLRELTHKKHLPFLIEINNTKKIELIKGSSYALRYSEAEVSDLKPILINLLEINDEEVKYNAIMGLFKVDDLKGAPSFQKFKDNPSEYINHWN